MQITTQNNESVHIAICNKNNYVQIATSRNDNNYVQIVTWDKEQLQWRSQNGITFKQIQENSWKLCPETLLN